MPQKQENVDDFMEKLDYPLKAEVQTLRAIIKAVSPDITEQIKWNTPSYSYKDYIDRRLVYFASMNDVEAKKVELERVVKALIKVMDE